MGACASKPEGVKEQRRPTDTGQAPKEATVKGQDNWETVRAGRRFSFDVDDQTQLMAFLGATQDEHKKLEEYLKACRKGFVAPRPGAIKHDSDMAVDNESMCSVARVDSFTVAGTRAGGQRPNQDSFAIWDQLGVGDLLFVGVFDGHGPHGHYISRHVRERLPAMFQGLLDGTVNVVTDQFRAAERACKLYEIHGQTLQFLPHGASLPAAAVHLQKPLMKSFLDLDDDLCQGRSEALSIVKASAMESGTTAVAAILWEKEGQKNALVAMVGDSVAYLVSAVTPPQASKTVNESSVATDRQSGRGSSKQQTPSGRTDPPSVRRDPPSVRGMDPSTPPAGASGPEAGQEAASLSTDGGSAWKIPNAVLVVNPTPHKPVGTEADRIRAAGGRLASHPGEAHIMRVWPTIQGGGNAAAMNYGVALSRALAVEGGRGESERSQPCLSLPVQLVGTPDLFHIPLLPEHKYLVLCSDGVSDVLSATEVLSVLQKWTKAYLETAGQPLQPGDEPIMSAAKAVVTAATAAWMMRFPGHARDDISAQVIFLGPGSGQQ